MDETFQNIEHIIFDLGGVLIDWDPRYLYRKIYQDHSAMESFLGNICTPDWNEKQDEGREIVEATRQLTLIHPEYTSQIEAFYGRWSEMLDGSITETENLLYDLHKESNYKLVALTNWSAETFPIAQERFKFLEFFEDIIVSGIEKCKKPDPRIYQILVERTGLVPQNSLFIDDSKRNIMAAEALGFQVYHFTDPARDVEILREKIA